MKRTGVVAKKLGMSCFFDNSGRKIPVTLLQLEPCQVIGCRDKEKHGYSSLLLGYGAIKNLSKVTKPIRGIFAKVGLEPKRKIKEFRITEGFTMEIGEVIGVDHFLVGQCIDVVGVTVGKGFAGAMKRHNFRGLEASHGVSVSHRSHGSTGGRQDPGKVFKNKKMAGHMGSRRRTVQNLLLLDIDPENNILIVKGAVPGSKQGIVYVSDAVKG